MTLNHKVAFITGASGGIGSALALSLAKKNVSLTLTSRNLKKLELLAKKLRALGNEPLLLCVDLKKENQIIHAFEQSNQHWGRLDILINNAAFGMEAPIQNGNGEVWKEMLEINVLAVALAMREALRYFDDKQGGQIINLSSTSAYRVSSGGGFYAATKFAIRGLSEVLRQELATANSLTRVSCVSPGRVATSFFKAEGTPPPSNEQLTLLNPDDVVETIMYLLSCSKHVAVQDIILRSFKQVI